MERTTGTRTGRKPKSDPADHKYSFRLNAEENTKFEKLLADSGAGNLTLFIKKSIFSGQIKVVKIDKATMDYYIRLTEFHKQFQAVGNNYYNPQIEMFARFKMKSSFHKTKRII